MKLSRLWRWLLVLIFEMPMIASFAIPSATTRTAGVIKPSYRMTVRINPSSPSLLSENPRRTAVARLHGVAATAAATSTSLAPIGGLYMALLAIQFGAQPRITQTFCPQGSVVRSTYVLVQDLVRFSLCAGLLIGTGSWRSATAGWTGWAAARAAGIPALLYAVQNYASLVAYQNLSAMSYNVLNQTKTLSSALWCYLLLQQQQTPRQMVALGLLVAAALVMERAIPIPGLNQRRRQPPPKPATSPSSGADKKLSLSAGVPPVLLASLISGLAGALTQKTLQTRNSLLLSGEMALLSATTILGGRILQQSLRRRSDTATTENSESTAATLPTWNWSMMIPILTNAMGGILVGLVTKYAGSVRKGFALIAGVFLAGLGQQQQNGGGELGGVPPHQWCGGALAGAALFLYLGKGG